MAAKGSSADRRVPGAWQATDRVGGARLQVWTGISARRRARAPTSSTRRSAASLMRRIKSPACEAILPARLNRAKRSFLGRALDRFEGRANACTARGLRPCSWTSVDCASLRPLRFIALRML